ncbi:hypothetical protein MC885_018729 [Smutsia gigantea]|nr:hypothetical protein MC885_018729 [Smutsia gigantea]
MLLWFALVPPKGAGGGIDADGEKAPSSRIEIRSLESGKGGMKLVDSKASLICQAEGPLLLVFLGPFQREQNF